MEGAEWDLGGPLGEVKRLVLVWGKNFDWRRYPQHVQAAHLSLTVASPSAFTQHPLLALGHAVTPYSARKRAGLTRSHCKLLCSLRGDLRLSTVFHE